MQLRRFAEQVLVGATLEDKLVDPGRLVDDAPGAVVAVPLSPGRPAELPLRSRERPRFPAAERLGDLDATVTALHAFANHELLAVELMALALLRFPDADPAFRADLAQTLREEQLHLRLYLDRLAALGHPFGCRPLSAFFWDALSEVDSPRDFCAGMGLTLEQANLDFAGHFARAFEDVGDETTASLLRRVLADEVVHVARGLRWFDRLRGGVDRWEDWLEALPPKLSPRRARGPDFTQAHRARAGLDDAFVERVRTWGGSRGRPSDVHWFNPPAEVEDTDQARAWMLDLEPTAILRASDDDLVLLHRQPGRPWLAQLAEAGFPLPSLRVVAPQDPIRLELPVRNLLPWARTAEAAARLAPLGDVRPSEPPDKVRDAERLSDLLDDLGPPERLVPRSALPRIAGDLAAVEAQVAELRADGWSKVVFKRRLGTSGRGQRRLFEPELLPEQRRWLQDALTTGPVRVEPWFDRRLDLSFQLDVVGFRDLVRFYVDATGRFLGAWLGRATSGLPSELARFCSGDGRAAGWIDEVGRRLAFALRPQAPVGVDAFVYRGPDGLRLHPYVERNPRLTFGRLALDLRARIAPGCVGVFLILGPAELRRSEAGSLQALAADLAARLPQERRRGLLRRCALPTSDPAQVRHALPLLLVAPEPAELHQALGALPIAAAIADTARV